MVVPVVETLKLFNSVRKMYFRQELQTGYEEKIKDFSVRYRTLNISVPLKVCKTSDCADASISY